MRRVALGLLIALLAGCANLPPAAMPARPARPAIAAFDIEARLSIRNDQQIHVAHVSWRHRPDADEIFITGPLGQGVAELHRDAAGARLLTADRRELAAADWNALGEKVFGSALPLDGIPHWITGDVPGATRDAQGRPLRAEAGGWRVSFVEYESARADALPTLIHIERDDIVVKLKIDQW